MIRNFRTNKSWFNLQFNYRASNVIIPIGMALNDEKTYPTIVAITSYWKLQIQIQNMIFIFYIHQNPLLKVKINLNLFKKNIFEMKNFLFQKAILSRHINSPAAYYRLYLSDLFPNIDKMIYLMMIH
jgi:lipopolysaccharide biosynthesis glycosyltransferase